MSKKGKIIVSLICFVVIVMSALVAFIFSYKKVATINIDYSKSEGEICHGAIGWLYGMSEPDVPSGELLRALKPQISAVKTANGLQHPMGDVMQVGEYYIDNGGQELFIYMQDIYPEWYYVYRGQQDYLNKVNEMMDILITHKYKDQFIYCPFNENDNGKWYGDFKKKDSRNAFYKDWKVIFDAIKAKDENAYIAGPGYMKFNIDYLEDFLLFCKNNDCMPNMMVWHELSAKSYKEYEDNYKEYREVEKKLKINPLRICISEYGRMKDNGVPGQMVQFISMFEKTKVDACIAYWRLANNLSDIVADNTTPSAAWWLYYWYSQMSGNTYLVDRINVKDDGLNGLSTYDENKDLYTVLLGGQEDKSQIILSNIDKNGYKDGDVVYVDIEYVDYMGLTSDVLAPTKLKTYKTKVKDNKIILDLNDMSKTKAYKVEITKKEREERTDLAKTYRYEAEDGKIEGVSGLTFKLKNTISTKKLTYASSNKIVSNFFEDNKIFQIEIDVADDGLYKMDICYGNGYKKDGTSDKRAVSKGYIQVGNQKQELLLDNTISKETMKTISKKFNLSKGTHTIKIYKGDGYGKDVAIDFIDVTKCDENDKIISNKIDDNTAFVIAKEDGYYLINSNEKIIFNEKEINNNDLVYLKKGINIFSAKERFSILDSDTNYINFTNSYNKEKDEYAWTINAPIDGKYAISLKYSNNAEYGSHEYNIQHVEKYATLYVNDENIGTYYFRNTFSWENIASRTIYLELKAGENIIVAKNDKSYIWNNLTPSLPLLLDIKVALMIKK